MCYIPEKDPVQDAIKKIKNTTHFKFTLPNTKNKLKVAMFASGAPEQFLLHVCTVIHACKQMGLDANFTIAERTVETTILILDIAKMDYTQIHSSKKSQEQEGKGCKCKS